MPIARTLCRIEHAVERLTHTRDARGASPGAIAAADLPLLRELARDGLPVEVHVWMAPAHVPLRLGVNRIIVDAHEVKVLPANLDCKVAHALLGGDKGTAALLRRHGRARFLRCARVCGRWRYGGRLGR